MHQISSYPPGIARLGGSIQEQVDTSTELLVLPQLSKVEKVAVAIALGTMVVKPSFLDSSIETGYYVDPSSHEWKPSDEKTSEEVRMISSISYWRQRKAKEEAGPFAGWKVFYRMECLHSFIHYGWRGVGL